MEPPSPAPSGALVARCERMQEPDTSGLLSALYWHSLLGLASQPSARSQASLRHHDAVTSSGLARAWGSLRARFRGVGDSTLEALAPGRPAEEISVAVQSTVGLPATDELIEWLALHDGPVSGGSVEVCATGLLLVSFDKLAQAYRDRRELAEELGPDVGGADEIWPSYFFPAGPSQERTLGYDLSPVPVSHSWRVRSVFTQALVSESPGIDSLADLIDGIVMLIDAGAFEWSSGRWHRHEELIPDRMRRLRMF